MRWIRIAASFLICSALPLFAQTNLVANGSFESGLTNWTFGQFNESGASGTCSYNAVTAPGVEALTSTAGFPATDGTGLVLGSVQSTGGTGQRTSCTLYQDIAIPVGVTSVTLKFDLGAKAGNDGCINTGAFVAFYPTSGIPGLLSTTVGGPFTSVCTSTPASSLATFTTVKNVTGLGGTTVRLAIINAANVSGHEVIGVDNVQVISGPSVTSVNPATGSTVGGNTVTLTGVGFTGATSVTFGGVAAASFTVVNDTTITAVAPAGGAGAASVIVTTPAGSNAANTLYSFVVATPTLGEWGMIALTSLLVFYGWLKLRRQDAFNRTT